MNLIVKKMNIVKKNYGVLVFGVDGMWMETWYVLEIRTYLKLMEWFIWWKHLLYYPIFSNALNY